MDITGVSGSTCETLWRLCSEPDDSDGLPDALKRATAGVAAVAFATAAEVDQPSGDAAEKFKADGGGSDAVSAIAIVHVPTSAKQITWQ